MADPTLPPPPPPAPGQGADAPLPPIEGATAPAAAKKPAAKKPAAKKPEPAPAAPTVPAAPAAPAPNPYAPAATAAPAANPYAALPAAPSSTLSVLALVFGIMGLVFSFFFLGLLPAIGGVILGHLALKREPHARGMAIAGLSTGYVGIAISVLWGLVIVVPLVLLWFGIAAAGAWGAF